MCGLCSSFSFWLAHTVLVGYILIQSAGTLVPSSRDIFALLRLAELQHYGWVLPQGTGGVWKKIERNKIKTERHNCRENILRECRKAKAKESNNLRCCKNCVNLLLGGNMCLIEFKLFKTLERYFTHLLLLEESHLQVMLFT